MGGRTLSGVTGIAPKPHAAAATPSDSFRATPEQSAPPSTPPGVEFMAKIADLVSSPYQAVIRRKHSPGRVDDMAKMLKTAGQKTPITVRRLPNGKLELIKGHRRTLAATSIGWTELRAILVVATDAEAKSQLMLDNESDSSSDYIYSRMFEEVRKDVPGISQASIGEYFGRSQAYVSNCLRMLELPPEVLATLDANPFLFGSAAGKVVRALWDEHTQYHEVIISALLDLGDDEAGTKQNQLRKTVETEIIRLKKLADKAAGIKAPPRPRKQLARRQPILSPTGQECYVTILKETSVTVDIKDTLIDKEKVQEVINKALMDLVKLSAKSGDE